jgi:hypothetical protein
MAATRTPKSKFGAHEDACLSEAVRVFGTGDWWLIASAVPNRTSRQCRERWSNYLNPGLSSHGWTEAEDRLLLEKVNEMGCRWGVIVGFFDGRSKNSLRNRYRSVQRRSGRAPRADVSQSNSPLSTDSHAALPAMEDPFAFMDRIDEEWNISWHADCDPFFPWISP